MYTRCLFVNQLIEQGTVNDWILATWSLYHVWPGDHHPTTLVLRKDIVTLQEDTPHRSLFLQQNPYDCGNNATSFSQPHGCISTIPDHPTASLELWWNAAMQPGINSVARILFGSSITHENFFHFTWVKIVDCWLLELMSIHWDMAIARPLLLPGSVVIRLWVVWSSTLSSFQQ